MPKKGDTIVFLTIIVAFVGCLILKYMIKQEASQVVITYNNKEVYKDSVYEDAKITLPGNTVVVQDGKVKMEEADCKNQICVNHAEISKKGESIICLPNKVTVEIK